MSELTPLELAERVAQYAASLGIETALIGAYALAAHGYVRATDDADLATDTGLAELGRLQAAVEKAGFHAVLREPDDEDDLGGVLRVWTHVDEDGDPIELLDVVNFNNPHRPRRTPARQAIRNAITLPEKPALRYPRLADLIALKLFAGALRDDADVVELLVRNPAADLEQVRSTAKDYGFDRIDTLITTAQATLGRSRT